MDLNSRKLKTIHIRLLDEIVDVWRPTKAVDLGDGLFCVLPTDDYNPDDEEWEFPPGTTVQCKKQKLSEGETLIAIEKVGK
jgi:hypothetical protein